MQDDWDEFEFDFMMHSPVSEAEKQAIDDLSIVNGGLKLWCGTTVDRCSCDNASRTASCVHALALQKILDGAKTVEVAK